MRNQIFSGKGAKNNEQILRILFEKGQLTAWGLSKELALLDPKKPKDSYHKAQKIQSVLLRKNGRLEDLVNKEFIEKKENTYLLTATKGFCSATTLFDEEKLPKPSLDFFSEDVVSLVPELKIFIQMLANLSYTQSKEGYREVRKVTMNLLDKGLHFEKISNEEFGRFYNDEFEQYCLNLLKAGSKSPAYAEWTPELKEASYKLIAKLSDMCQVYLKELVQLGIEYKQKSGQLPVHGIANCDDEEYFKRSYRQSPSLYRTIR